MLAFPDPSVSTEYTDPNGSVWEFNGTGWVRQGDSSGGGGGTVAAPYVEFLLNGDDAADGSQDIFDASGRHGIVVYNDVYISTAEKKYGTGSLDFTKGDGYVSIGYLPNLTPGQNINVPYTRSLAGVDLFTIEGWFNNNGDTTKGMIIADERPGNTTYTLNKGWKIYQQSGAIRWDRTSDGYNLEKALLASGIEAGQWHHFAATWDGSTYRLFLDGVLGATSDSDVPVMSSNTCSMTVGAELNSYQPDNYTNISSPFNGYIDDLMVSIGACKYTDNFTPPGQIKAASFARKRNSTVLVDAELEVGEFQDYSEEE